VTEVMHDLACAPLAGDWMCAQAVGGKSVEGVHDLVVTGGIRVDELVSFFGCHRFRSLYIGMAVADRIANLMDSQNRSSLGLNREPFLLYYSPEPRCANDPVVL